MKCSKYYPHFVAKRPNFQASTIKSLPTITSDSKYANAIVWRVMLLNCLTVRYKQLWEKEYMPIFDEELFSKNDNRLDMHLHCGGKWRHCSPLRSDYERRMALVEIDVLVAMAFGVSIEELKNVYRLQFHILRNQEQGTWYDAKGRIVYTNNRSLIGTGVSRSEFEDLGVITPIQYGSAKWNGIMRDAPEGYVFARTITDDTMPGGPVERTIEYVAPFDRCNREEDYDIAWKYFEEKYK